MLKRGLLLSFGQTGASFVIQFSTNIILARLLIPSEIGIYSVSVAAIGIIHALRDFGIGSYLLKERDLTTAKIRTVFGVAILVGWSFATFIFFGRSYLAAFYNEPQVAGILGLLSINFLLLPIGQPALSLMRRERRYGRIMIINLSAAVAAAISSVFWAMQGSGPYALAYGALTSNGVMVILLLWSRPDHILLLPSLKEWRSICQFGGLATAASVVVRIGGEMPELIIGRVLGFRDTGIYSRGHGMAYIIEVLFGHSIRWVTTSEIGARFRGDGNIGELIIKTSDLTILLGWPALAFLALKSEAIIWLLYGNVWLDAAPIMQALCVARAVYLLTSQSGPLYEGTGAVRLRLRNEIIIQVASVGSIVLAALYSLEAIAWSRVAISFIAVVVHFTVISRYTDLSPRRFIAGIWRPMLISALFTGVLGLLVLVEPMGKDRSPEYLVGEAFIMGVAYLIIIVACRHPFVIELLDGMRAQLAKKPSLRQLFSRG